MKWCGGNGWLALSSLMNVVSFSNRMLPIQCFPQELRWERGFNCIKPQWLTGTFRSISFRKPLLISHSDFVDQRNRKSINSFLYTTFFFMEINRNAYIGYFICPINSVWCDAILFVDMYYWAYGPLLLRLWPMACMYYCAYCAYGPLLLGLYVWPWPVCITWPTAIKRKVSRKRSRWPFYAPPKLEFLLQRMKIWRNLLHGLLLLHVVCICMCICGSNLSE